MNEIASKGQLRLSYLRWALVTVPLILFLGFMSGQMANSGYSNRWFVALNKPELMPPAIAFPVVWSILYILLGLSLAIVIHARGARYRGIAIAVFLVQLACNLAWSPLFFAAHQVTQALMLILGMIALTIVTIALFFAVRRQAGLMLIPYLAWLCFAAWLNYEIHVLNPDAETLVAPALRTHI